MDEDLIYCNTCRRYTSQILLEEMKDLAIKSRNSLFQKLQCMTCKRINERELQYCKNCQKHTTQSLLNEKPSHSMEDTMEQTFKCGCGEINKTSRDSDECIYRFLHAKDEEGGIDCGFCMCKRKQELINKQHSKSMPNRDLTTYKCKTCGRENYGTEIRADIR